MRDRFEYAETLTDVIARRTRLSFLDASATAEVLPRILEIMAKEKGWSAAKCAEEDAAVRAADETRRRDPAPRLSRPRVRARGADGCAQLTAGAPSTPASAASLRPAAF